MITYKIIKEHQGSITIQSSVGVGTKVEIFFADLLMYWEKRFFQKKCSCCVNINIFIKCFKKGFFL